jgi:hypothetical protein
VGSLRIGRVGRLNRLRTSLRADLVATLHWDVEHFLTRDVDRVNARQHYREEVFFGAAELEKARIVGFGRLDKVAGN